MFANTIYMEGGGGVSSFALSYFCCHYILLQMQDQNTGAVQHLEFLSLKLTFFITAPASYNVIHECGIFKTNITIGTLFNKILV